MTQASQQSAGMRQWHLRDVAATRAAGQSLGMALLRFDSVHPLVITLQGELGAGKTTLVAGLLAAVGQVGPVRSPTYTLIEPYELAGRHFYHLDLYRLTDPLQLEELGVRDLLQPDAVLLVEWPERAGEWLAKPDLRVQLQYPEHGTEGRLLQLFPVTESLRQLVDSFAF
ncbi:MAG: tRNA (adenosine(37)-N6)-threonylcarbamoyltransferase complex ATPase subunit type 1 TsaE [Steroidobacteraceae bacterium]